MYSLALIIFVVYEKKAFVLFFMPIRNPRWLPPQVIVLTQDHMGKYRNIFFSEAIALIDRNFVEDLPMIIPGQLGFNCSSGFREEAF
jgi:hypothetical protein